MSHQKIYKVRHWEQRTNEGKKLWLEHRHKGYATFQDASMGSMISSKIKKKIIINCTMRKNVEAFTATTWQLTPAAVKKNIISSCCGYVVCRAASLRAAYAPGTGLIGTQCSNIPEWARCSQGKKKKKKKKKKTTVNFPKISHTKVPDKVTYANSADPYQTAPEGEEQSDHGLLCLPFH